LAEKEEIPGWKPGISLQQYLETNYLKAIS
jgi:hypothetical protein